MPEDEARNIEEEIGDEDWESDWGSIFLAVILLLIVVCGLGVAAWSPWVI